MILALPANATDKLEQTNQDNKDEIPSYLGFLAEEDAGITPNVRKELENQIREQYPDISKEDLYKKTEQAILIYKARHYVIRNYDEFKEAMADKTDATDKKIQSKEEQTFLERLSLLARHYNKKIKNYMVSLDSSDSENIKSFVASIKNLSWREIVGLDGDRSFLGEKVGFGKWLRNKEVNVRFLTDTSDINNNKSPNVSMVFSMHKGYKIMWRAEEGALKIDWSKSENLESAEILWPVPKRLKAGDKDFIGYEDLIAIPLKIIVKDVSKPLDLVGGVEFAACNDDGCKVMKGDISLFITSGETQYETSASSFMLLHRLTLPDDGSLTKIKIKGIYTTKLVSEDGSPTLRVKVNYNSRINNADLFIENDKDIKFSAPRLSVNGDDLWFLLEADKNTIPKEGLVGTKLKLTVRINNMGSEADVLIEKPSVFDINAEKLTIGLVFIAIFGGFLLNLMPCVFPVMAMKFMSFAKFGGGNKKAIRMGLFYTIVGIFLSFWGLAAFSIILKQAGVAVGWGVQFQEPLFLLFMIALLTIFACNLFGIFEFAIPAFAKDTYEKISNKIELNNSKYKFILSNLVSGFFATLLSTPCTAPFLGTAVGFALARSSTEIIVIFNAIALGLSLPYILVCALPQIAINVPPPGAWLIKLRRVSAGLFLLTVVWLIAILVAQVGIDALSVSLGMVVMICFAMLVWYRRNFINVGDIIGHRLSTGDDSLLEDKTRIEKIIAIMVVSIISIIFIFSAYKIKGYEQAYQNQRDEEMQTIDPDGIWYPFNLQKLNDEISKGRVVLVDVNADWCLTCKYNQATSFFNPSIRGLLKSDNYMAMRADWTRKSPEIEKFLERFGRRGIPFYAIFGPMVPEGRALPELLSADELRDALISAKESE